MKLMDRDPQQGFRNKDSVTETINRDSTVWGWGWVGGTIIGARGVKGRSLWISGKFERRDKVRATKTDEREPDGHWNAPLPFWQQK
jgi:hypothetical protein